MLAAVEKQGLQERCCLQEFGEQRLQMAQAMTSSRASFTPELGSSRQELLETRLAGETELQTRAEREREGRADFEERVARRTEAEAALAAQRFEHQADELKEELGAARREGDRLRAEIFEVRDVLEEGIAAGNLTVTWPPGSGSAYAASFSAAHEPCGLEAFRATGGGGSSPRGGWQLPCISGPCPRRQYRP